ncbi:hypothetical protein KIL84_021080 [Mauremys mutica]|uniref:Rab-GAP TBC domain-containing protein n=1 Tax=Mauremys mutica TaxID=74926 RepID=A0A9D3XAV9_9SAUR|nr:hypothetical protein KIL84_021080 [Mauremys mutica]
MHLEGRSQAAGTSSTDSSGSFLSGQEHFELGKGARFMVLAPKTPKMPPSNPKSGRHEPAASQLGRKGKQGRPGNPPARCQGAALRFGSTRETPCGRAGNRKRHPCDKDKGGEDWRFVNEKGRRIVATWQRGAAGTGDWSKIQEQPPRRHVDGDGTCIHGPESQLPATSSLQSLFDGAGRLDLAGLRKVVYETGMDASERKVTWKFLFGVYPADSTTEERRRLDQQLVARYRSMKNAWKQQFPSAKRMKVQSDLELSLAIMKYEQQEMEAAKVPAEHGLWLQSINQPQFWASLRDIDADVPRTDRHRSFFQRQGLVKLLYLREILITFAAFHQDIGYCQGMTSFASHFLETLDSEFDAFWCFVNCMRHWAPSLTAQGVACKIREQQGPQLRPTPEAAALCRWESPPPPSSVHRGQGLSPGCVSSAETTEELLRHVDPELHHHIARTSKERLLFCLSWLLLRFQRELGHEDALRVMEIGALEGDPTELAARLLPHCREGEDRSAPHRDGVSFEVLLCVALLIQHRQQLLQYQHVHDFFLFAHRPDPTFSAKDLKSLASGFEN